MSTSWRMVLTRMDVVKGFLFTEKIVLWSSSLLVPRSFPGLLVQLASRFLLIYYCYYCWYIYFVFKSNHGFLHLHWQLFVPRFESSTVQLQNAGSTLWINFWPFICLISPGIMKEETTAGHEILVGKLSKYYWTSKNGRFYLRAAVKSCNTIMVDEILLRQPSVFLPVKQTFFFSNPLF